MRNFSKKGGTHPPSPREVNSRGSSPAVGRFAPSGLPSFFPRLIEMIPEFILFPLGNNGGPATGLDLPEMPSVPLEKPGVVGTTDITTTYLSGLKELLDPFPEAVRSYRTALWRTP